MAFERPSLSDLVDRIQQDFVSRLPLNGSPLRRSVVYVLARVLAGASHMLHGHLDFLSRQLFPDQSEAEFLRRQGRLFGVDPIEASFASGDAVIWGTNATVIPDETALIRSDDVEYLTDGEVTVATLTAWATGQTIAAGVLRSNGGNIYLALTAGTTAGSGSGPSGTDTEITDNDLSWRFIAAGTAAVVASVAATIAAEAGNADLGVNLTFVSPVSGANSTCTVSVEGLTGGADEEAEEDYRARVMERMQEAPQGGAEADYIAWAKTIAGVTRVWVYPEELGAGTVVVRFVRDNDGSGSAILPSAGEVSDVQDYIDTVRPVTASVTVEAPTALTTNYTLAVTPDTTEIRAAVTAELDDLYTREAEPGDTLYLSQIRTAIGNAEGLTNYTLAAPVADVTPTTSQIPIRGTITFT